MTKAESHLNKYIEISLFRTSFEKPHWDASYWNIRYPTRKKLGRSGCTVKTIKRLITLYLNVNIKKYKEKLINLGGTTEIHFVL